MWIYSVVIVLMAHRKWSKHGKCSTYTPRNIERGGFIIKSDARESRRGSLASQVPVI